MRKSIKIVSMVIAITLVMAVMIVVIYAAISGNVGINAHVSWTAQAGVDLEFWATATGGDNAKSIDKIRISPSTTNSNANILGDLSCNFKDSTDDGVNNPSAIIFKYCIQNKSLTPLNIKVTEHPLEMEGAGTGHGDHTPKVELLSMVDNESILDLANGSSGYNLQAGDTFEYLVRISMASGGVGDINADYNLQPDFKVDVRFDFSVATVSNPTVTTNVDGESSVEIPSNSLGSVSLGDYLSSIEPEVSTGWFFD